MGRTQLSPGRLDKLLDGVRAISFDLFDTLIQRGTARPEDVFALLEPEVSRLTGGALPNFQEVRPQAAWLAKLKRGRPREESAWAEIYDLMVEQNLLSRDQARQVQAWELAAEKRLIQVRRPGAELLKAARAAGRRVIIITDTYSPAEILRELLGGLDLDDFDALYASSEYRAQKYYGDLFELVLAREGLAPEELLHIGDHIRSDVEIPGRLGIRTFHLPKATDNLKNHPGHLRAWPKGFPDSSVPVASLYPALSLGLSAVKFFDDPENLPADTAQWGGLFQIGYGAAGPALAAFALWLARAAAAAGIQDLYFLSRDGWLPRRVFDLLAPLHWPELRSHYLYNSRKAVLAADIRNAADIIGLCATYFRPAPLAAWLGDKFGLSAADPAPAILKKYGLSPETVIDMDRRKTLVPLCLDLAPVIYRRAAERRAALGAYLNGSGFTAAGPKAVVDIGFSGAIQAALARMTDDPALAGFYFFSDTRLSRPARAGLAAHSFFEGFTDKFSDQFAHKYLYHYFETFFKPAGEGGLEGFEADADGSVRPVLKKMESPVNAVSAEIQAGAEAFARDLAARFGPWLKDLPLNPYSACQTYFNFFLRPAPADARLLAGFSVDDVFCGSQGEFFLSPAEGAEKLERSYWKEGPRALDGR